MRTEADRQRLRERIRRWTRNAIIVSVLIHAIAGITGAFIVAFRATRKPQATFTSEAPPRPALEPRKLELKVRVQDLQKQSARPRLQQRVLALSPSEIALPEIKKLTKEPPRQIKTSVAAFGQAGFGSGVGGGLGSGFGGGLGGGLPLTLSSRCDPVERAKRLNEYGGDANTEKAVLTGLNWLQGRQNADGSWGAGHQFAMTGLALLAFLGHCETPDSPQYGTTVRKAIDFLVQHGQSGRFSGSAYEHAIATYALAEAYTMTKLDEIRPVVERTVPTILQGQNTEGGWRYSYAVDDYDLSVSGWQVQALKAADLTGLKIPGVPKVLDKAIAHIRKTQGADGQFPYQPGGGGTMTMTGVGVYCLQLWKEAKGKAVNDGIQSLLAVNELTYDKGQPSLYGWYYCTLACSQKGGSHWRRWNRMFQKELLRAQGADGSWPSEAGGITDQQAGQDGPTYRTCLCILMLEVYYRYLPSSG